MDDEYLTVEEVAEKLKVSKMTIYRYIKDEKLPAYKIEQGFRIKTAELRLFIENRKV